MLNKILEIFARKEELKKPESGWTICEVVGESFKNEDGSSRQDIIKKLRSGDTVYLSHDANNPYSKSGQAISVITDHGQIGHLPEKDEKREAIFFRLEDGLPVEARVLNIMGGSKDRPSRGVWIEVRLDMRNELRRKEHRKEKHKKSATG